MLILTIIVIGMAAGWVAQLILGRVPTWERHLSPDWSAPSSADFWSVS